MVALEAADFSGTRISGCFQCIQRPHSAPLPRSTATEALFVPVCGNSEFTGFRTGETKSKRMRVSMARLAGALRVARYATRRGLSTVAKAVGGDDVPLAFRMSRAAYAARVRDSLEPGRREAFWLSTALEGLEWFEEPTRALDVDASPTGSWFPDGAMNLCHNALDRHVAAGLGAKTAIGSGEQQELFFVQIAPGIHLRSILPFLVGDQLRVDGRRREPGRELRAAPRGRAELRGELTSHGRARGRPRAALHAHGPRGGGRDARVRADRRGA